MKKIPITAFLTLILSLLLTSAVTVFSSPSTPSDLTERLFQETAGKAEISYHSETGMARFIGSSPDNPIFTSQTISSDAQAGDTSLQFLTVYGSLFGLQNPTSELTTMKVNQVDRGNVYVRYQQVFEGIPVIGGELIVTETPGRSVTAAIGEIMPGIALDTTPKITSQTAKQKALGRVSKDHDIDPADLVASDPELWIYNPALLGGPGPRLNSLVWRVEVTSIDLLPIRELVLVEAHLGFVALNFNQIDTILYRSVHDNNNDPTKGLPGSLTRLEGGPSTGQIDTDNAYNFAGDTYNFYSQYHRRNSIDDRGMSLVSTVRYCPSAQRCPFPNAFWNGKQMVYGAGFASADDVVAHELTHGVTEFTSGLFYYMQSGAINEALSDIWGEFVDLTNGQGNDSSEVRWLMGEDLPSSVGVIRSMKNPLLYGDPDKMSSSRYYCGEDDNGGVHWNSGVANKAAYLMTDGDTFNGKTIKGIGIQKTAQIWYEAQANLLTSAADYNDLYNGLLTSCSILSGGSYSNIGSPPPPDSKYRLYVPLTMDRYFKTGISAADCQEVKKALDAVEMYMPPPGCAVNKVSMCALNSTPVPLFADNLENPNSGNWVSGAIPSTNTNAWFYPQYPNPVGFDATYATSGKYNFWGYNLADKSDYFIAMAKSINLPAGSTPFLHFKHAHGFEGSNYDGGVIEFSVNNGTTWLDAGTYFPTDNGYNGLIASGYENPLKGREAFVSNSYGYQSSRLHLASIAGQNVRFRFRIGTDNGGTDDYGWFIDDINIYTCSPLATPVPGSTSTPALPSPTVANTPQVGPEPGYWMENYYEDTEFYVTPDRTKVNKFSILVNVEDCGTYKITNNNLVPILGDYFSFTGAFYASGTFDSKTTAYGETGLDNFLIGGCGWVDGGPWYFETDWVNSSQPSAAFSAELVQVEQAPGKTERFHAKIIE